MNTPCALRVTAADRDTARVSVRRQQFSVGRPIEFDEQSVRISAVEYALGVLGAELVNGLRGFAHRRRLALEDVEALVTAEVENALTFLEVVGCTGDPRMTHVHVKLYVTSSCDDEMQGLWNDVERRLPLLTTLRAAVPVNIELVVLS